MAWVRIHDGALGHPKIAGLVDLRHPFTLWVWGLSHCQMHLTDGVIVTDAVPRPARKAAAELVRRHLWESHDLGWKVHDYLSWNDCRDLVLERQNKAKDRKEAWRARQRTRPERVPNTSGTASGTPLEQRENAQPNQTKPIERVKEQLSLSRAREKLDDDDGLGDRARELLEHYPVWYAQERHGARLPILGGNLQWEEAKRLCATWDDARLEKLARVILSPTDDAFIEKSDRGWKIFVTKAAWADDRLKRWELEHGVTA